MAPDSALDFISLEERVNDLQDKISLDRRAEAIGETKQQYYSSEERYRVIILSSIRKRRIGKTHEAGSLSSSPYLWSPQTDRKYSSDDLRKYEDSSRHIKKQYIDWSSRNHK